MSTCKAAEVARLGQGKLKKQLGMPEIAAEAVPATLLRLIGGRDDSGLNGAKPLKPNQCGSSRRLIEDARKRWKLFARLDRHSGGQPYLGHSAHNRSGWLTREASKPASMPVPAK